MTTPKSKEQLITEFTQFMANLPEETFTAINEENSVDIFTLCQEFIALKTAVKLESRQFKTALESFKEIFYSLQQNYETFAKELSRQHDNHLRELAKQQQTTLKPLLLSLLELYDRLQDALKHSQNYRPHWLTRIFPARFKAEADFIASSSAGQAMTLRRLEQLLANYEVTFLSSLHQPFNPQLMRAVAIEQRPDLPNQVVTVEIIKGAFWQNQLLRLAEVKVNNLEETIA